MISLFPQTAAKRPVFTLRNENGLFYSLRLLLYHPTETIAMAKSQSPHVGGINVAMGDGSTRIVSSTVSGSTTGPNWGTWGAALTPNGNDILGPDWNE
jgi:prepilin-type processing-associated H-X9-DG protein